MSHPCLILRVRISCTAFFVSDYRRHVSAESASVLRLSPLVMNLWHHCAYFGISTFSISETYFPAYVALTSAGNSVAQAGILAPSHQAGYECDYALLQIILWFAASAMTLLRWASLSSDQSSSAFVPVRSVIRTAGSGVASGMIVMSSWGLVCSSWISPSVSICRRCWNLAIVSWRLSGW